MLGVMLQNSMVWIASFWLGMQPEGASFGGEAPAAAAGQPAAGTEDPGILGGGTGMLIFFGLFAAFMYFFMIRPQQKEAKVREKMLSELGKGDIVRTNGGIRGEIIRLDEKEVTLLIADKTKINILRSAIAGPIATDSEDE